MTKEQKIELLGRVYSINQRHDKDIYIISDKVNKEEHDAILDLYFKFSEEVNNVDLRFEIMSKACDIISELSKEPNLDENTADDAIRERSESATSVYTGEQLSWLDVSNQQEISDLMLEYGCDDIATACGYWYTNKLVEACEIIKAWVEEEN